MSFELNIEEIPLVVSGVPFAHISGVAEFSSSGEVEGIRIDDAIRNAGRKLYLTGKSADPFKNQIFQVLAETIKLACFARIQDAMADYRRDNVASLHDWKRKNAAEMAG